MKIFVQLFHKLWLDLFDSETQELQKSQNDEVFLLLKFLRRGVRLFYNLIFPVRPGEEEAVHTVHHSIAGCLVTSKHKIASLHCADTFYILEGKVHLIRLGKSGPLHRFTEAN